MTDVLRSLLSGDATNARDAASHLRRLWTISAAVGLIIFLLVPITYWSDSGSYVWLARVLASGVSSDVTAYFRTPGYPLLVIATGVVRFETFRWLVLAQLGMAISMPIVIYRIVSIYGERVAYYTALLSIASLVPYGYAKSIMTEELYIFLLLIALYLGGRYLTSKQAWYVYAVGVVLFALLLVRPVANYLFVIFWAVMIWASYGATRRLIPHLCVSLLLFPLLIHGYTTVHNAVMADPRMAVSTLNMANGIGRQLFYNVYLTGGHLNNEVMRSGRNLDDAPPFMTTTSGPAEEELIRVLAATLTPQYVAQTKRDQLGPASVQAFFYEPYLNDPKKLVAEMARAPSMTYFFYMSRVLDDALGAQKADQLFLRLSLEILKRRPLIGVKYVMRNIYFFAAGVSIDYIHALHPNYNLKVTQSNLGGLVAYTPVAADEALSRKLSDQLIKAKLGGEWNTRLRMLFFYHLWTPLYLLWRPLVFLAMIVGPALLTRTAYGPVAMLALMVVLYHMLIVCVFAMPVERYVTQTILIELVAAVPASIEALRRLVKLGMAVRAAV